MQVSDAVNTGRRRHLEGTVMAKLWAPAGLLWIWRMAAGSGRRRTAPARVGGTTAAAELLHGLLRFQGEQKEGRGGRARPAGSHLSYLHAAVDTTPEPRPRPMRRDPADAGGGAGFHDLFDFMCRIIKSAPALHRAPQWDRRPYQLLPLQVKG